MCRGQGASGGGQGACSQTATLDARSYRDVVDVVLDLGCAAHSCMALRVAARPEIVDIKDVFSLQPSMSRMVGDGRCLDTLINELLCGS